MKLSIEIKNINEVKKFIKSRPAETRKELDKAVQKTVLLVKGESKRRTPVDTGRLRTSIKTKTRQLEGEVFTDVKYAIAVHENLKSRHPTGEAKYLENAIKHSKPRIQKFFKDAIKEVIKK